MKRASVVAFLGPSLPAAAARAVAKGLTLLPPAGRGDVWRALDSRPRAIALIDGVFESRPSVWHREILEALEAGVAVFGGASMGALRACELGAFGMVGVGRIFRWFRDGVLNDDGEVALLHAGASEGYRPLTVPLVNVRWVARRALDAGVLRRREALALVSVAAGLFYQERRWPSVLGWVHWPGATRARFERFAATGLPDLKAEDARACLAAAARFVRQVEPLAKVGPLRWPAPSPLVRRRLRGNRPPLEVGGAAGQGAVLAALARELGLCVGAAEIVRARRALARRWGTRPSRVEAEGARLGANPVETARFFEEMALAELVRERAPLLFSGIA
ncbi:MAG: TfuA-like protein [Myxococcales bacterium]